MNKTKSNKKKSCCQVSILESENWMRHAASALFGPVRRCVRLCRERRERTPPRAVRADLGRFSRADEGRKSKQDKHQASSVTPCSVTSARSAGSYGVLGEFQSGVKIEGVLSLLRSLSLKAYTHKKKVGVMADAGLPNIRFHDLRHTFATHALTSGVDAKTLSGILGHTKTSFTLDTYTHVTGDMHQRASEIVGSFMEDFMVKG